MYYEDNGVFDMEKTLPSQESDLPDPIAPTEDDKLPEVVKESKEDNEQKTSKIIDTLEESEQNFTLKTVNLTQLLSLYGMEEEMAQKIKTLIDENKISTIYDLKKFDFVNDTLLEKWSKNF